MAGGAGTGGAARATGGGGGGSSSSEESKPPPPQPASTKDVRRNNCQPARKPLPSSTPHPPPGSPLPTDNPVLSTETAGESGGRSSSVMHNYRVV